MHSHKPHFHPCTTWNVSFFFFTFCHVLPHSFLRKHFVLGNWAPNTEHTHTYTHIIIIHILWFIVYTTWHCHMCIIMPLKFNSFVDNFQLKINFSKEKSTSIWARRDLLLTSYTYIVDPAETRVHCIYTPIFWTHNTYQTNWCMRWEWVRCRRNLYTKIPDSNNSTVRRAKERDKEKSVRGWQMKYLLH